MGIAPDDIIDVSEYEACRRLDQLLDRVESGALVFITRGTERVAVILREDIVELVEDSLWASRAAEIERDEWSDAQRRDDLNRR